MKEFTAAEERWLRRHAANETASKIIRHRHDQQRRAYLHEHPEVRAEINEADAWLEQRDDENFVTYMNRIYGDGADHE
jgi:hypothetical protein